MLRFDGDNGKYSLLMEYTHSVEGPPIKTRCGRAQRRRIKKMAKRINILRYFSKKGMSG